MIDIIIPLYNTNNKLFKRCLSSIAMQTMIDDISVVIVDDCSSNDYSDILETFNKIIDISYIKLESNVGSGFARKCGYENSNNKYVMYVDSDDSFASVYSVEKMFNAFSKDNTIQLVLAGYMEEYPNLRLGYKGYNITWLFSKMYKREELNKYGIEFTNLRYNEDACYNMKVFAMFEKIAFIDEPLYNWHNNQESLTRCNRSNVVSACNFVDAYIQSYDWKESVKITNEDYSNIQNIDGLILMYMYYCKYVWTEEDDFTDEVLNRIKIYYDKTV